MDAITLKQLAEATGGEILSGKEENCFTGVCTDSRKFQPGDLFVALIGERQDAHRYIGQIAEAGGIFFLVSDRESVREMENINAVLVDDTLAALQSLAGYYLDRLGLDRIAVTGSVGKTSTRDMIYHILSRKYVTGKPIANYNSDVGVPLTIFGFDSSMQMCVLEEGMEWPGEIHRLASFTRPNLAVITNVGVTHMENLGSRENIYKAKMEITDFFGPENILVINEENDMLDRKKIDGSYKILTVSSRQDADYRISDVLDHGLDGIEFRLRTGDEDRKFRLPVPGAHNAINAGLAIAACRQFGVTMDQAAEGLSGLELTGKRLQLRQARGIKVLDDSYNAAPDSVKSAIDTIAHTEGKRRIAILGDMNELGEKEKEFHLDVGRYAAEHGMDIVFGIGSENKGQQIAKGAAAGGAEAYSFPDKEAFYPTLADSLKEGDVILIKASMTRHFWEIADKIING